MMKAKTGVIVSISGMRRVLMGTMAIEEDVGCFITVPWWGLIFEIGEDLKWFS